MTENLDAGIDIRTLLYRSAGIESCHIRVGEVR